MHSSQFLLAASLSAAVVLATTAVAAQSVPGMSRQPVEVIDNRLLPLPGEANREFKVEDLEGAPVTLGGAEPVGIVEAVVQGLEEQISFVVSTNDRFGNRRVLLPISDTVVWEENLVPSYTLTQLRALPTLTQAAAANLAPIADDVAIRLRRSELEFETEAATSR